MSNFKKCPAPSSAAGCYNIGRHFNATSGIFHVPITGIYKVIIMDIFTCFVLFYFKFEVELNAHFLQSQKIGVLLKRGLVKFELYNETQGIAAEEISRVEVNCNRLSSLTN